MLKNPFRNISSLATKSSIKLRCVESQPTDVNFVGEA